MYLTDLLTNSCNHFYIKLCTRYHWAIYQLVAPLLFCCLYKKIKKLLLVTALYKRNYALMIWPFIQESHPYLWDWRCLYGAPVSGRESVPRNQFSSVFLWEWLVRAPEETLGWESREPPLRLWVTLARMFSQRLLERQTENFYLLPVTSQLLFPQKSPKAGPGLWDSYRLQ